MNFEKQIPVLFEEKHQCCGCTACFASCTQDAISMISDEEGFLYPSIDGNKCIRCYACIKVCAFKKSK